MRSRCMSLLPRTTLHSSFSKLLSKIIFPGIRLQLFFILYSFVCKYDLYYSITTCMSEIIDKLFIVVEWRGRAVFLVVLEVGLFPVSQ